MGTVNLVVLLYALLSIGLGFYGYFVKNSSISLIAGGVAGLLLLGTLALAKTSPRAGRIAAAVISIAMLGNFAPKFFRTGDWLPPGVMTIASVVALVVLVGGHFLAMRRRNAGV